LGGALGGCQAAARASETPALQLGVSPDMATLAQGLVDAYHLAYPQESDFQISVVSANDLQADLGRNRVTAVLDWNAPESENWAAAVGWTGIVLAVNRQNDIQNLSRDQARLIFLGLTDRWESVGGSPGDIHCLNYEASQDLDVLFQNTVLHQGSTAGCGVDVPAPYAMIQEIQKDRYSIGYILGFDLTRAVRPVTIDQTAADYANLLSSKYPFRVPVFVISRKPVAPEVSQFAGWAQSTEGQLVFLNLQSWE
jgi:phosphate transport system substrate-binding protein